MFAKLKTIVLLAIWLSAGSGQAESQPLSAAVEPVPQWGRFEIAVANSTAYENPYEDVTLEVTFTRPDGTTVNFWGFYDGDGTWRTRFMLDRTGPWEYRARFSDGTGQVTGIFTCVASDVPGLISRYRDNPIWFGFTGGKPVLIRSLHVGDRLFADGDNTLTGDPWSASRRRSFLDWAQVQGYNMLSVASHYLNRQVKGRGQGWNTPDLWNDEIDQPNPTEYRRLEEILDDLARRRIMVYPFAGFFGRNSDFPKDQAKQELYLRYTLARLGPYWNVLLMVGGPEPLLKGKPYLSADEIHRLGLRTRRLDVFGHLLSVHNATGPDVFANADWTTYGILQGPKTLDRSTLSRGLLDSHHDDKPLYAQETLWPGNKYHPEYSLDDIRKNALVMMMSAATVNFADMDGDSSSGFSGSMDLNQRVQARHDAIKSVWDFFETIPFWQMTPRQDLVDSGYCLADPGQRYLVYLERPGSVTVQIDEGPYAIEWINAQDTTDVRSAGIVRDPRSLTSPADGDDWLLSLIRQDSTADIGTAPAIVAEGAFPDIQVDGAGHLHLVYARQDSVYYRCYDSEQRRWMDEQFTQITGVPWMARSEPDIVVDSEGRPHVFAGSQYARVNNGAWNTMTLGEKLRDTELAIDSGDTLYLVHRQGNHGGYIGLRKLAPGTAEWMPLTDPDRPLLGRNNHVYPDLAISPVDQSLHVVYRHGNPKKTAYRQSTDGGQTWPIQEGITDHEPEAAHIVVDRDNNVYVTDGAGNVYRRTSHGWISEGQVVEVPRRGQPELAVDRQDRVYCTCWSGRYNVRVGGRWIGSRTLTPATGKAVIGFVEPAGADDFAYLVWEEGEAGNPDEGIAPGSVVVVGRLLPDGTVKGL